MVRITSLQYVNYGWESQLNKILPRTCGPQPLHRWAQTWCRPQSACSLSPTRPRSPPTWGLTSSEKENHFPPQGPWSRGLASASSEGPQVRQLEHLSKNHWRHGNCCTWKDNISMQGELATYLYDQEIATYLFLLGSIRILPSAFFGLFGRLFIPRVHKGTSTSSPCCKLKLKCKI